MAGIDVSFIISIYHPNTEYFAEMLPSVLRLCQKSRCATEILFRDDTDAGASRKLLATAARENPDFVRLVPGGKNLGVGFSRCELVNAARGRYVASFDQDDVMLPFDLDRAVKFLDDHSEYAASYAQKFLFNSSGLTGEVHGEPLSIFQLFFSPKININAMLIRREELIRHESFLPCPGSKINDDVFLMMRLGYDRDIYFDLAEPRCLYRDHEEQYSKHLDKQEDFIAMGQYFIARNPELYNKLCRQEEVEVTPRNRRLVQAYSGLAAFLNQKIRPLAREICRRSREREPRDYGVWDFSLILSIGTPDFDRIMQEACRIFADDEWALYAFYRNALLCCRTLQKECGAVLSEYRRLRARLLAVPELVRHNLPESARRTQNSYTYNLPPLKI